MKVKELIEKLQKLDPELPIVVQYSRNSCKSLSEIMIINAIWDNFFSEYREVEFISNISSEYPIEKVCLLLRRLF